MRVLIFGGSECLGRHLTEQLLGQRHNVTVWLDELSESISLPGAKIIRGDRSKELKLLGSRCWDVVIDVSGHWPSQVGKSAAFLQEKTDQYVFISSISVYADLSEPRLNEESAVSEIANIEDLNGLSGRTFGARKALCELTVEAGYPNCLVVRSGVLGGPYDDTGRVYYWLKRISLGGDVLVPGIADRPLQLLDARDLAFWIIGRIESGGRGIYNCVGPAFSNPLTFRAFLTLVMEVLGVRANLHWVDEVFLLEHHVMPWTEIPLWVPHVIQGVFEIDGRRAEELGLPSRPLSSTIRDTWQWMQREPSSTFAGDEQWLDLEREAMLLEQYDIA